eukprot:TRINITY_DN4353_c0_g1_i3.p2 TRINITY_DN4353_c0_g1~~TRINITY_DN4353_c0_g1_i3.p2  ORF type:complete len:105 (+),score=19.15 TRINITY_DN4353_c0_g1_i3:3-317(+)
MTDLLLKCVCAGSHGVGKTSIITRYIHNTFNSHHSSTIGIEFNLRQIQLQDGRTIRLQLWEMAPQREFKTITTAFYRGSAAVLLVFNLGSRASFDGLVSPPCVA